MNPKQHFQFRHPQLATLGAALALASGLLGLGNPAFSSPSEVPVAACQGPSLDSNFDSIVRFYGPNKETIERAFYFEYDGWSYLKIQETNLTCTSAESTVSEETRFRCTESNPSPESFMNHRVEFVQKSGKFFAEVYFDRPGRENAGPALTLWDCETR